MQTNPTLFLLFPFFSILLSLPLTHFPHENNHDSQNSSPPNPPTSPNILPWNFFPTSAHLT